jgi:N6-adenosine-specific RNA methylase IME4
MKKEDIQQLPIKGLCADDCVLFLWVTFPCLEEGLELIKVWGFKYKTCGFTWCKRNKKSDSYFVGLGYWTRANAEICLIATKGKPKRVSKSVPQICDARIMEHSKKPTEIRGRIVDLCGDLPRIELFARQYAEGWDCWGNEV